MKTDQSFAATQIYLTQAQQARLSDACKVMATTQSELIRRAIDQFLEQVHGTPQGKALRIQGIAGMWAQRDDMVNPVAYVEQLRAPCF